MKYIAIVLLLLATFTISVFIASTGKPNIPEGIEVSRQLRKYFYPNAQNIEVNGCYLTFSTSDRQATIFNFYTSMPHPDHMRWEQRDNQLVYVSVGWGDVDTILVESQDDQTRRVTVNAYCEGLKP